MEINDLNCNKISNIKSYKLNKTLENSIYPLEQELKEINNNTISNSLNNLVGIVFSGIGTSVVFSENCVLDLLAYVYDFWGISTDSFIRAIINSLVALILFLLFYFAGLLVNNITKKRGKLYKKKGSSEGRSELREIFHKSIINDIVIGISFVNKAEEIMYEGDVAEMYLYEAAYYFIQYMTGRIEVSGFSTLVISIWLSCGLIIMFLGMVGVYIGKIFDQVKGRPTFIISERINFDNE